MPDAIQVVLKDASGAPVTTAAASLVWTDYRNHASGAPRLAPSFAHLGGGVYRAEPSAEDVAAGVAFLVTAPAGAYPERTAGAVFASSAPFATVLLETAAGALWAGAAPAGFDLWTLYDGTTPAGPAITTLTAYLFAVKPTAPHAAIGVHYAVTVPSGAVASGANGTLQSTAGADATVPVISAFTPADGTVITPTTPAGFTITDAGGNLESGRFVVSAYYPSLQRWEVVYHGAISARPAGFGPQYTGTITEVTPGTQYVFANIVRSGGWPARVEFVVRIADKAGNEAA